MKIVLIALLILLPCLSFAQGPFRIKIGQVEFPIDKIPDPVNLPLPQRFNKFLIKKDTPNSVPTPYIVQIGEEEHSFSTDGAYHEVVFSHDIKGLVVYILNEKRIQQGKPFKIKGR